MTADAGQNDDAMDLNPQVRRATPVEHKVLARSGEGSPKRRSGGSGGGRAQRSTSQPSGGPARSDSTVPAVAIGAIVLWTIFFAVAYGSRMTGGGAEQWAVGIAVWAVPVLLVIAIWLLVQSRRSSAGERFPDTAGAVSDLATELEERLASINRELAQARESMTAHAGDLEGFGRSAIDRISANAEKLEKLIVGRGEQLEVIARASAAAVTDVDRLQEKLPTIANAARELTQQIDKTSDTARLRIDEMASGFQRLEQAGTASGDSIAALRSMITQQLDGLESQTSAIDAVVQERMNELRRQSDVFRQELETREEDSFAAIRRRAALLHKELSEQDIALLTRAGEALDELRAKMSQVREEGIRLAGAVEKDQGAAMRILETSLDGV